MLTAFSCATNDNIPELLVAIASFRRHNPDIPVLVFHERSTDTRLVAPLGVELIPVSNCHVFLSGVDYIVRKRKDITGRAIHISHNTLTRSVLSEFADIDMGNDPIATQHFWAFPELVTETTLYQDVDSVNETRRQSVNSRYFSIDFLLLDIDILRERQLPMLTPLFVKSLAKTEEELFNLFFSDKPIIHMPSNLGTRVEHLIHNVIDLSDIMANADDLREARVVVFSGDVKPWSASPGIDRRFVQIPFKAYLEEIVPVEPLLPVEFVEAVADNTIRSEELLRRSSEPTFEISDILEA